MTNPEDPAEKFKKPLQRPSLNLPARRMDTAEEPAPAPAPPAEDGGATAPGGLARLLSGIADMLRPRPALPAPSQTQGQPAKAVEPPVFTVMVAALNADEGGAGQAHLLRLLESVNPIKVRSHPRAFRLDSLEDPAALASAQLNTRHAVAAENADLLVWGDVLPDGSYRLRLATASSDEEKAGGFGPLTRIELPAAFSDQAAMMFVAALLAATDTVSEQQKATQRRLLPQAAQQAETLALKPPIQMSMGQQRSAQLVFAHVAATCAQIVAAEQAGPWFDKALAAYRAAHKRLGRTDPVWETGLLHKYVAATLTARADREKANAKTLLAEAAKEWRQAAESVTKAAMPQEWAAIQNRLGMALYRLDLLTGDMELLREAVQVLQAALGVYSRTETPQRWAEVMNNLAQVLEVYGDQLKSPELLKRAIDACDAVLEIRTRERTPLAWAATQNTLGGALFLLDKHSDGTGHLDDAAAALQSALEVFQSHGARGPAQVAARNLGHVRKLAEERRGRQVIDPHWAEDHPPRRRR